MTVINIEQLTKTFGQTTVVKSVDLDIADQEFLVLLGPSGCGKTTIMRMIAGLEQPTFGSIKFDGKRINELPTQQRDVAMVFQNYGLYPHMNVARNIGYPLKLRGLSAADIDAAVQVAARRVELTPYLGRMPRELSGGQRQRVALARSIVRTPKVFLMDEPLSNLDALLRVAMRAEIKHLAHELKVTTVYVTHDQVEAMTLAHRIALMKDGVIQQLAKPQDIYNDPVNAFVAGFIGNPAMNLLPCMAEGGRLTTLSGLTVSGEIPAPARGDAILGVRAEDATLCSPADGHIAAEVFTCELLGDETLVSFKQQGKLLTVKTDKSMQYQFGERVGIRLPLDRLYWFDAATSQRIRT
ncbi:MAG: ABC transporter ATP-binding protein [Brachymonas sp.]